MTTRMLCLAAALVAVVSLAVSRMQLSYDLGYFLPAPTNDAQRVLVERLGQGPGAQYIFAVLPDSTADDAAKLAQKLRLQPLFTRVLPESLQFELGAIPPAIWRKRLLLADLPDTETAWTDTLEQRLDDLMLANDTASLALIAADPALTSIQTLSRFTSGLADTVFEVDGNQIVVVETAGSAFDIEVQAAAVATLREALQDFPGAQLLGSGVYGVDLRASVQTEARLFSILAGVALLAFMIWHFRSATQVIGIALPLLTGGGAGLLALTLVFDQVHGITLAFGFTLLGVAIDYPLHLYIHQQCRAANVVWPTLRLGIFSTLIAYGAFMISGTLGLQQLGVFAFFGIATAALSAAWLIDSKSHQPPQRDGDQVAQQLRHAPWMTVMLVTVPGLLWLPVFEDDLSALTPVDASLLATDAHIRRQMGIADIRYLVAHRGQNLEDTLIASEIALKNLAEAQAQGALGSMQSIVQILPSQEQQQIRRDRLRQPHMLDGFTSALANLPFNADAFSAFTTIWQQEMNATDYLQMEDLLAENKLSNAVQNLMYEVDDGWVSLIYLRGINDLNAVHASLASLPGVQLIDLKDASTTMVAEYRQKLLSVLGAALVLIALLLFYKRNFNQLLWLFGTVGASLSATAAASAWWQSGLSLFDVMALTLVAGLGLDYALFYSRDSTAADTTPTRQAVLICAASSLLVFGVLSFSSIPVLQGIGTTVAFGVCAAYLLARLGRYENSGA